eukprot:TRINITY_DN46012_c0_g1_i1.p2 TRINITY_DN46012_c0_g1~~TRINITY_DN46012_c0_g1_i1.p2  ORF type:complete len:176 (+),score=39.97 TRINITY_DN46012_c0_g1_i1:331-858(+)
MLAGAKAYGEPPWLRAAGELTAKPTHLGGASDPDDHVGSCVTTPWGDSVAGEVGDDVAATLRTGDALPLPGAPTTASGTGAAAAVQEMAALTAQGAGAPAAATPGAGDGDTPPPLDSDLPGACELELELELAVTAGCGLEGVPCAHGKYAHRTIAWDWQPAAAPGTKRGGQQINL